MLYHIYKWHVDQTNAVIFDRFIATLTGVLLKVEAIFRTFLACPVYCFHFVLVQVGDAFEGYEPGVLEHGPKMVLLNTIIEESLNIGDKILVFRSVDQCQWRVLNMFCFQFFFKNKTRKQ